MIPARKPHGPISATSELLLAHDEGEHPRFITIFLFIFTSNFSPQLLERELRCPIIGSVLSWKPKRYAVTLSKNVDKETS